MLHVSEPLPRAKAKGRSQAAKARPHVPPQRQQGGGDAAPPSPKSGGDALTGVADVDPPAAKAPPAPEPKRRAARRNGGEQGGQGKRQGQPAVPKRRARANSSGSSLAGAASQGSDVGGKRDSAQPAPPKRRKGCNESGFGSFDVLGAVLDRELRGLPPTGASSVTGGSGIASPSSGFVAAVASSAGADAPPHDSIVAARPSSPALDGEANRRQRTHAVEKELQRRPLEKAKVRGLRCPTLQTLYGKVTKHAKKTEPFKPKNLNKLLSVPSAAEATNARHKTAEANQLLRSAKWKMRPTAEGQLGTSSIVVSGGYSSWPRRNVA